MIDVKIFETTLSINKTYLIIGFIISLCVYMFSFAKKNPSAGLERYFYALRNFLYLCVVTIFLVVGYFVAIAVLNSGQYIALIIPLGWYLICYVFVKRIAAQDFNIIIGKDLDAFWDEWRTSIILFILGGGFSFATYLIFMAAQDRTNQPYGPLPLVIIDIVFLLASILTFVQVYKIIIAKMQLFKRNHTSS